MFGLHCTQFKEYFHRLADTPLSLFEEIDPFHAFYAFSFKSFFSIEPELISVQSAQPKPHVVGKLFQTQTFL